MSDTRPLGGAEASGPAALHTGVVAAYDEQSGLGELAPQAGAARVPFHCTAITDGTRTIEVGSRVIFWLAAGHRGRMEAAGVTRVG